MLAQKISTTALVVICTFLAMSCASIMHGTRQEIGVSSSPTGAHVMVDGIEHGTTPCICDLKRKNNHVVRVELDGYEPYEINLTRRVSGWVWGNIAFGGLIGLAVDAIDGGIYKLTPEQVVATLQKQNISSSTTNDSMVVEVVLQPNKSWRKIGSLNELRD